MSKRKTTKKTPDVHESLDGMDIKINRLGQLEADYDIDKINGFLNENVEDRKLADREEE